MSRERRATGSANSTSAGAPARGAKPRGGGPGAGGGAAGAGAPPAGGPGPPAGAAAGRGPPPPPHRRGGGARGGEQRLAAGLERRVERDEVLERLGQRGVGGKFVPRRDREPLTRAVVARGADPLRDGGDQRLEPFAAPRHVRAHHQHALAARE